MIDRINRVVLWALGLLLLAAGLVALVAGDHTGGELDPNLDEPYRIHERAVDTVSDAPGLWLGGAIAVAALVLILCLVWIRHQFRRRGGRGIGRQQLDRTRAGRVEVEPAPVARAVAADLRALDGVSDSAVRVTALAPVTEIVARLDLVRGVDVAEVRRDVDAVLERLGTTVGSLRVDADIRIRLAGAESQRVV